MRLAEKSDRRLCSRGREALRSKRMGIVSPPYNLMTPHTSSRESSRSRLDHMDVYAGKNDIRNYLAALNRNKKVSLVQCQILYIISQAPIPGQVVSPANLANQVLEYCLFQPGLFVNYLTHPHRSAKHVTTFEMQFDFQNRRAIIGDGGDNDRTTLTSVQDLAAVVARAVEYEGTWPVVGGIRGCEISISELLRLGEEIRGKQSLAPPHDRLLCTKPLRQIR